MASWYCGKGGSDANDGTSWAKRKLTIGSLMGVAKVAGDRMYVGSGAYREQVDLSGSGSSVTTGGTVSVSENSTTITGSGTNWNPAVQPGDRILVPWLAESTGGSGTVTGGGAGITDAGETFEAGCVGFMVTVRDTHPAANGGNYIVASIIAGPPNGVNFTDLNAMGLPGAGAGYWYYIPSNEGTYEIASVESDTSLTLTRPWSGPDYTGRSYRIFRPIYLIGDSTGTYTDGVGGVVRITGSDDDLSINSAKDYGLGAIEIDYWVLQGFQIDSMDDDCIRIDDATYITVEDMQLLNPDDYHIRIRDESDRITIRRCEMFGGEQARGIYIQSPGVVERYDKTYHIENCAFHCETGIEYQNVNNVTVKNCSSGMSCDKFVECAGGGAIGVSGFVHDCDIRFAGTDGLDAAVLGQIVANLNNYWANNNDRTNVGVAGGTNHAYMYLPETPLLRDGYRYPVRFFTPSEWWECAHLLGLYGANQDINGVLGPSTKSKRAYGPYMGQHIERETTVVYSGEEASLTHPDARTTQFRTPITGVPVTVSVWVYVTSGYSGTYPKLVVHQEGNDDVEDTASGTDDAWEQLSVDYTPNSQPLNLWIELVSDNTASAVDVYWQHLQVAVT